MAKIRKRSWTTAAGETRIAWACDFADHAGNRQRKQFRTRREADAFRVEIEGQLRTGVYRADADKLTVADVASGFLEHAEGRSKRGERFTRHHLATVKGHVGNYICPDPKRHDGKPRTRAIAFDQGVGSVKLSMLTSRVVGDFRDRLRDAGVSVVTTRKILSTLSAMLAWAVSQDMVAVNAAQGIKVIGRRDEGAKKIVPPAKDALKALIDVADADFKVELIFAAASGVRAGELHALRWKHLDLDAGEATIEARVDAYGDEDVTKTAAGMRTVPLAGALVTMLKEWRLRSRFKKADDLVFPNRRGGYTGQDNMVKRQFLPLFDKLEEKGEGIEHFNWHALRHYAVSTWIEAGLAPKTIQTFAGHSSLQVTMDRYGHMFKSDDHKTAMDLIAKGLM
ncbi:integrase [Rhodovulum sp. NI22]|nr:integrase [Rhodovulum sp. NI22]